MKIKFKITRSLLSAIRLDLMRPHAFAHERVGFISGGLSSMDDDLLVLAREFRPVDDEDYLPDTSVGAMMGPNAIRAALQWSLETGGALFHVHTHGGRGVPGFSGVDLRENQKFVPDFFKVTPQCVHGAIVLSDTAAHGQVWISRTSTFQFISGFTEVGIPLRKWSTA